MKDGFAKELVERERIHSRDHYHNYRHVRGPRGAWGDNEVGGREKMRIRYNHGYDRKSFNENLNPLWSWLNSCVGKNWNKQYGDLRKKFDARNVINAHILQHLFQEVEIHTFVGDKGQVMFMSDGYRNEGPQPISKCYKDYYVCPKSGMLRRTNKQPRRSVIKQREAEKIREELKTRRVLDSENELHLIDGVWFHLTVKSAPLSKVDYRKPFGTDTFLIRRGGYSRPKVELRWDELSEKERKEVGTPFYDPPGVRDVITGKLITWTGPKRYGWSKRFYDTVAPRYFASKATASHKLLKQAGIV